jgi:hypothetical protein
MTTEIKSHQSNISRDALLHGIAKYCIKKECSIDRAIADFIQLAIKQPDFKVWLSGSIYTGFYGNSQDYALTKLIKVNFGQNSNMIIGNIVHKARDVAIQKKIINGVIPKLSICIREMRIELNKQYQYIKPEEIHKSSKLEIFKKSIKLFRAYYKEVLPTNKSISSEVKMEVSLPIEMFKNPENAKYFAMTGIADSVDIDNNGNIIITDLKTSGKRISGKVEDKSSILEEYQLETQKIEAQIKKNDKIIKKFENATIKYNDAQKQLIDIEKQLNLVLKENEIIKKSNEEKSKKIKLKATTSLINRKTKWKQEVQKWEIHINTVQKSKELKLKLIQELLELNEISKPLYKIYEQEKYEADLEACKKAHQTQLLHYVICYMFEYRKMPTKVRIENIVKHEKVEIQIFEWEFTREDLLETQEKIFTVINTIELLLDGVDPMIVMRLNHTGYIGLETELFKDEVKKIIKAIKNI